MLHQPDLITSVTARSISSSTRTSERGTTQRSSAAGAACAGAVAWVREGGVIVESLRRGHAPGRFRAARPSHCRRAPVAQRRCGFGRGARAVRGGDLRPLPHLDGGHVVVVVADVEPESVVAIASDTLAAREERRDEIGEVECAFVRYPVERLRLEYIDPHADVRDDPRLLLERAYAATLFEVDDPVLDLYHLFVRRDRDDVPARPVVVEQIAVADVAQHVAVHHDERAARPVQPLEGSRCPERVRLVDVRDLRVARWAMLEDGLDQV